MTVSQKNWWKNNLFNVSTLIAMLTFIVVQAKWQEHVDGHIGDESVHMKFEKKIEIFVPRIELDGRIENIEKANARMEKSLIRIEEKLNK